ncbi:MAG TPA: hypothetical protein VLL82_02185 [Mycobacterium sp.]|nr:hypothetical protein [Mycobacterium sp.]
MSEDRSPLGKPLKDGELAFEVILKCTCGCGYVFKSAQHAFLETQSVERAIHHIAGKVYRVVDEMDRHLDEARDE